MKGVYSGAVTEELTEQIRVVSGNPSVTIEVGLGFVATFSDKPVEKLHIVPVYKTVTVEIARAEVVIRLRLWFGLRLWGRLRFIAILVAVAFFDAVSTYDMSMCIADEITERHLDV